MWAIVTAMAEVGRRCRSGEHPRFQAELERSEGLFDEYVRRNSDIRPEGVERFKREQGLHGAPENELCTSEITEFYEFLATNDGEGLRRDIDQILSRPGPATWGECL